ncbi:MAG: hypothetical protein KGJ74_03215 [Betaproteobacteria bacterium]|jgi:hypothetical protein|nr:hypothetical protein [Thiomonas sp.]MDE2128659.1 hypothetical protein [Betaproteobacteria bacterium]
MQARADRGSGFRLAPAELKTLLQAEPVQRRERIAEAAGTLLGCIDTYARRGAGMLADVLGRHAQFEEWAHYPAGDAVDRASGYSFYYHAHEARQRMRGEHGHFHVFGPAPTTGRHRTPAAGAAPRYLHIVGISVDDRGFPLRLFTTNQWVTDERWLPAAVVIATLHKLDLRHARPARLARWVEATTRLFSVQIAALLHRRDARVEDKARHIARERLLADRRTHILSQCRVDLASQFQFLEGAGIG